METRLDRYEGAREAKIAQLRELIENSKKIVFLGGAGVSTESGIPDFRSGDGTPDLYYIRYSAVSSLTSSRPYPR